MRFCGAVATDRHSDIPLAHGTGHSTTEARLSELTVSLYKLLAIKRFVWALLGSGEASGQVIKTSSVFKVCIEY